MYVKIYEELNKKDPRMAAAFKGAMWGQRILLHLAALLECLIHFQWYPLETFFENDDAIASFLKERIVESFEATPEVWN